jgi:hypothetical protein
MPAVGSTSGGGAGASGSTFTYAQLEGLWIQNGGSKATAPIAAAIAMAESSGRALVTSSNPDGGTNVGLWQLDTKGKGSGYSVSQLQDPNTNAAVAVQGSSNGSNWSAWATYASGAYKAFMSNSTTPNMSGIGSASSAASAATTGTNPDCMITLPNIDLGVTSVGGNCILSYSQARAIISGALIGVGGVVVLLGLLLLVAGGAEHTGAGQAAGRAVKTAATVAPFIA